MSKVLAVNEDAYFNKYGISLDKIWNEMSETLQEKYLSEARVYIRSAIPQAYRFSNEEILRIVIGYRNAEQLKLAFEGAAPTTRLLLWEPDVSVFVAGCVIEDLTEYINNDQICISLGRDESTLKQGMERTIFENNILHRHIYAYGKYLEPDNKEVEMFIKAFEKYYVKMVSDMHYRKQYEHRVYENFLYSVKVLNNNSTITQFFDSIPVRDIPVIIVAAGPSLMKNCLELKNAKGRAIIVAVAHSMKTLARNNIKPDIIATTDPASPFFLDFDEKRDYTLLCCVYVNKVFQEFYDGKLVFYGFNLFRELFSSKRTADEIIAELDTGSVATDVLSMFIVGGFKRFILVGQDLAYDENGMSHTEGQKEVRPQDKETSFKFQDIEGIDGKPVKTRDDWILFRQYYENRIKNDRSLDIIDATEGGALIRGSRVMKLKDAIEEYCNKEYPLDEWISSMPKGNEEEKCFIDEWFMQQDEMNQRTSDKLNRIIILSKDILSQWNDFDRWDEEFSAKCKKYDVLYHMIMDGEDGGPIREYCRADLERYIEEALTLEGDNNIEARMRREQELFLLLKEKLNDMQEYLRNIRNGNDF